MNVSSRCVPEPTDVAPTVSPLRSLTLLTLSFRSPRTMSAVPVTVARGGLVAWACDAAAEDVAGFGAPVPPQAETSRMSAAESPISPRVCFMSAPPSAFQPRLPAREPALHDLQERIEREGQRGD